MHMHILKELQPTDSYEIRLPHNLSTYERQLVTLFYQPIIGADAVTMYLTMWTEAEFEANPQVHYYLMNVLGKPLHKIFETRLVLEAIGLLRTFKQQEMSSSHFLYELVRPLDAEQFFNDPLLSMFLFSKIGEQPYRKLRARFLKPKRPAQMREVTRTFIDVFTPVHMNMPSDVTTSEGPSEQTPYPFEYTEFDFKLLRAGLSEQLVPSSALTVAAKEMIAKLAFLYHFTPLDMQKIVIAALDEHNYLAKDRLWKEATDYYKLTVSKQAPQIQQHLEVVSPANDVVEQPNAEQTKDVKRHHYWNTTPPIDMLRNLSGGQEPLPTTMQLVDDLVLQYDMPVGVVNALIEYVMLTTDMKLPRKYVQTIADHWRRKGVKTPQQAMELARQEHDQYRGWKDKQTLKAKTPARKNSRQRDEMLPDWFHNRNDKPAKEAETAQQTIDLEAERKRVLQKLGLDDREVK